MEEMRGAAKAYYAHMSDGQHESFQSFYRLMDTNRDGKVSNHEYSAFIRERGYDYVPSNLFGLLDKNNTGYLEYEDCITLFYMVNCNRFVFCDRCRSYLEGLHFVCVECYCNGREPYNLCCSCYQNNNYNHGHTEFLDNYDLLHTKPWDQVQRLQRTLAAVEISPRGNVHPNKAMEDLVKTATLYYDKSSWDVKESAHDFFNSLDSNNDGKVSLHEFLECMKELGHVEMGSRHFFEELDKDKNGTLEFMEVMALYYIIKSGRPFCCVCDEFIPGMYFTCSVCFQNGNNPFWVCPKCFQGEKFVHGHNQFLDNFALLEAKRMQGTATYSNQYKPNSSVAIAELEDIPTSTINVVVPYPKTPSPSSSITIIEPPKSTTNADVFHNQLKSKKVELAYKGFEAAISGAVSAAFGNMCTIM